MRRTAIWLRSGAITLFMVAADLFIRRPEWFNGRSFSLQIYAKSVWLSFTLAAVIISVLILVRRRAAVAAATLAAAIGVISAFNLAANLFCRRYFHEYVSLFHLKFVREDPLYLLNYLQTYLSYGDYARLALPAAGLFLLIFPPLAKPDGKTRGAGAVAAGGLVVYALLASHLVRHVHDKIVLPNVSTQLSLYKMLGEDLGLRTGRSRFVPGLAYSPRAALPPAAPLIPEMRTMLLVINEAWGAVDAPLLGDTAGPMPALAARIQGAPEEYVVFHRAFANSTATEVSLPSILTGVGPHESAVKLHRLPLLSNMAKAAGFLSVLFSSQRLEWAHLGNFLRAGDFTLLRGASELDAPIINDLGIDDAYTARALGDFIGSQEKDRKIFLVFCTNALHPPYQEFSEAVSFSGENLERSQKARRILDHSLDLLLTALEKSGRLDDALVILTGDHGGGDRRPREVPRISGFFDDFIRIPLIVKLPSHADAGLKAALRRNSDLNTENIDIAPTMAQLLGLCRSGGAGERCQEYQGRSLLGEIPADRLIISLSTNELRAWYPEGFAVVRDQERLLFASGDGLSWYDVSRDPGERNDLWPVLPQTRKAELQGIIFAEKELQRIYQTNP